VSGTYRNGLTSDMIRRRSFEPGIASKLHEHPLAGRILASRGIAQADQLELQLKHLPKPASMRDFDVAVRLLVAAVTSGKKILIVGDYDADGATSTALACHVLRRLGASVDYLVPSRFKYGYGLSPEIVEVALQKKRAAEDGLAAKQKSGCAENGRLPGPGSCWHSVRCSAT